MPKQCSWCRAVQRPDRTWEKGPAVILMDHTHGICTDCLKKEHLDYIDRVYRELRDRIDAEGMSEEEFREVIELFKRI